MSQNEKLFNYTLKLMHKIEVPVKLEGTAAEH